MLKINWDWVVLFGLLLLLPGYVAYQRHCRLSDDGDSDEERSHER
jgi:hypothetical protein